MTLANCITNYDLFIKHTVEALNMPLLCNARISGTMRKDVELHGASQHAVYVDHTLKAIETINLAVDSAPNAAYNSFWTF